MILLAIGDVVGQPGMEALRNTLPQLKKEYNVDLTVVNGENAAETGTGLSRGEVKHLFSFGADVITTGNHSFRRPGWEDLFEETEALLRPQNYMNGIPGRGVYIYDKGSYKAAFINLIGQAFMNVPSRSPYDVLDEILNRADADIYIVDFHAESTSEKICLARAFDGKISVLFGTHTHVQTADESVYPGGTGYITDLGMTGPEDSVIGVVPSLAIRKQRYGVPVRFSVQKSTASVCGAVFDIDERSGKCQSVRRFRCPARY